MLKLWWCTIAPQKIEFQTAHYTVQCINDKTTKTDKKLNINKI